jgi:hypothetical protein
MENKKLSFLLVGFVILSLFAVVQFAYATPSGSTITVGNSTSAPVDPAGSSAAQAGNVTELTLTGRTTTATWQGYFGNVTGVIQLADGSSHVMYNWSQANPSGEVYASTNQTIFWTNIQCLNYTSTGTYAGEAGNGGQTSKYGTNLTQLQNMFGISATDADSVSQTFNLVGAGTHNQFYTASQQFNAGQCQNTRVYDSSGTGVDNKFEEALLYEPVSTSVVFTSLLNQDASGFDSKTHDFEMLVLENGHGADVATTPYYFFVELQ